VWTTTASSILVVPKIVVAAFVDVFVGDAVVGLVPVLCYYGDDAGVVAVVVLVATVVAIAVAIAVVEMR